MPPLFLLVYPNIIYYCPEVKDYIEVWVGNERLEIVLPPQEAARSPSPYRWVDNVHLLYKIKEEVL